jgi:hypothetical protein
MNNSKENLRFFKSDKIIILLLISPIGENIEKVREIKE